MTISEIWTSGNVWWSKRGGRKEGSEHGRSLMTNYAIHGEGISILDWTWAAKTSKSELLHGVDYGTNDKSNKSVEPPFTTIKKLVKAKTWRGTCQQFNVTSVGRGDIIQENVQSYQPCLPRKTRVLLLEGILQRRRAKLKYI
jgi:hypothetical protein